MIDWTYEQNQIVVQAYFEMLAKEKAGRKYNKAEYNRMVQAQTGRTRSSVEYKNMNISFLMQEIGCTILKGYAPARNTQRGSLFMCIKEQYAENFPILHPERFPEIYGTFDGYLRGGFSEDDAEDHRRKVLMSTVVRQGQQKFREELITAYEGRCAITGYNLASTLQACHILPYRGEHTNHVTNGLLLRSYIHRLFDLGIVAVNTDNMSLLASPDLNNTRYQDLIGTDLVLPNDSQSKPNRQALDLHREVVAKLK